ncbi:MAG: DNA polymerase III subunit alpha [Christensenellales bacterium]|jgi:DNA polymerase-3 subunit alpha
MSPRFVHLHVHTEYSLLDGASRIGRLLDVCGENGMDALAITDHGVMYGVPEFYKAAHARGIKPIIGCEIYVVGDMESKIPQNREYAHLIVLCQNNEGYQNLMALCSEAFTRGFYYRPRVDYALLKKHSEGLIALSGCLAGEVQRLLLSEDFDGARKEAQRLENIFGKGNFFLELQDAGMMEQKTVNARLLELSKETGIELVATNDVHYVNREDADAHEVLLCIQTGKTMDDQERMRFETDEFYLRTPQEMHDKFKGFPGALENTLKIAERCHVELDFSSRHLPHYDIPEGADGFELLRELCYRGLESKYAYITPELRERMQYELSTIGDMGFTDYFLIVWDFIRYAKENGIMVGPGRGSAAGSLVSYCLDITTVDPIRYELLFERFLNPDRITMPDIDIDFCYERRQEVIDYVVDKYGKDKVAQIITFGTMAARAVIRDVGRALNIPYAEVDRIAKMVPFELKMTIERALKANPELANLAQHDERVGRLIDIAKVLEGMPRHASTHAAGVVISQQPLREHVPLQLNDEVVTTQYAMGVLEEMGLLKMDFLGLRTLTVIRDAVDFVRQSTGKDIDMDRVPLDDAAVYEMLGRGETDGVFQLESAGMRAFMRELKPSTFEDIIAGISLYRPGPMESIPRYVHGKYHPESVRYLHPILEKTLSVTYGCMVYQEQVMQIVRDMAGYSLARSDLVRRVMSKKKFEEMKKEREIFIHGLVEGGEVVVPGAVRRGTPEEVASQVFDEMTSFAQYAFNKSHAAAYAMVAYQTAYLKCHYPVEFMAALLNSVMGSREKISMYIHYCRRHDIRVLPPDINSSMAKFSIDQGGIRFGLAAIKRVGAAAVEGIVGERQRGGRYRSFYDFVRRAPSEAVNKAMVESLIMAGCFDGTGVSRARLLAGCENILKSVSGDKKRNIQGQVSLFDMAMGGGAEEAACGAEDCDYPSVPDHDRRELLTMEREMTGVYISGHPLDAYRQQMEAFSITALDLLEPEEGAEEISAVKDGSTALLGGIISEVKTKITRSGGMMAFVQLEDFTGTVELLVFPKIYMQYRDLLAQDSIVAVTGRVSKREEAAKILLDEVRPLSEANRLGQRRSSGNGGRNQAAYGDSGYGAPSASGGDADRFAFPPVTMPSENESGPPPMPDYDPYVEMESPPEPENAEQAPNDAPQSGEQPQNGGTKLYLKICADMPPDMLEQVKPVLEDYGGDIPVHVYMEKTRRIYRMAERYWVRRAPDLTGKLANLLGESRVKWTG